MSESGKSQRTRFNVRLLDANVSRSNVTRLEISRHDHKLFFKSFGDVSVCHNGVERRCGEDS
jgi:hypothetical protein